MIGEIGDFKMKKILLIFLCWPMIGLGQFLPIKTTGNDINQCSDGSFIIAGEKNSKACLSMRGIDGDILWEKTYGGNSILSKSNTLQICDDGGFIVAGKSTYNANTDAYIFKTDKNGNLLWEKTYGGNSYDCINSMQICSDGGFILAGVSESINGRHHAYILRIDRNGSLIWEKKYGEGVYNRADEIQICDDGGFVVIGLHGSSSVEVISRYPNYELGFYFKTSLFKIEPSGNLIWEKKYGNKRIAGGFFPKWEQANKDRIKTYLRAREINFSSIKVWDDGGFIIAGTNILHSKNSSNAYIFWTDEDGDYKTELIFENSQIKKINSIQTYDGVCLVAGQSNSGEGYLSKIERTNPYLRNIIWEKIFSLSNIHTSDKSKVNSLQICSDSGYVMIGSHLIKTNADGNVYEATLMDRIKSFVESKINTWQEKGEFEKTLAYQTRVTQSSRNTKIENIQADALAYFKKEYLEKINFKTITLKDYDADNETFLLDPFPLEPVVLPVPISEASYFKQNFKENHN